MVRMGSAEEQMELVTPADDLTDQLTLGGYLTFDCPICHRRRLEFFTNQWGALSFCKCEKCGANSEDDSLSPTRQNISGGDKS